MIFISIGNKLRKRYNKTTKDTWGKKKKRKRQWKVTWKIGCFRGIKQLCIVKKKKRIRWILLFMVGRWRCIELERALEARWVVFSSTRSLRVSFLSFLLSEPSKLTNHHCSPYFSLPLYSQRYNFLSFIFTIFLSLSLSDFDSNHFHLTHIHRHLVFFCYVCGQHQASSHFNQQQF